MTLVRTRAILFRAHAYSETSQVLRFYTEALGLAATGVVVTAGKGGDCARNDEGFISGFF